MSTEPLDAPELESTDIPLRDGIGEHDNPIPLWFNLGFYGAIVIGVLYILYYTQSGWSQRGQFEAEMAVRDQRLAAVRAAAPPLPAANPFRGDAAAIAEGKQVFETICAACHLPDGRGLVGPSLIDPFWRYEHDDAGLFRTVSEGRPGGMPPWGAQLAPDKIWKVLAYVDTLPRSEAPGVGAPGFAPGTSGGS
ncbi:MAG TPA: c-type cytochrome [Myxococcota bacterium]|jgi:cytochrome c oxidase cbb3-type subunit 3|nr:c-type cytochrome [Myxococcota bacterium]